MPEGEAADYLGDRTIARLWSPLEEAGLADEVRQADTRGGAGEAVGGRGSVRADDAAPGPAALPSPRRLPRRPVPSNPHALDPRSGEVEFLGRRPAKDGRGVEQDHIGRINPYPPTTEGASI